MARTEDRLTHDRVGAAAPAGVLEVPERGSDEVSAGARPAAVPAPEWRSEAHSTVTLAPPLPATGLDEASHRRSRLEAFRALRTFDSARSTHFRWYFASMFALFGAMNMQMLVKGFLVFQLTGSYAALGTLALANAIPGLLLSLPGGVLADRLPKKMIQQVGSSLNALNSLSIALVLLGGFMRWEYLLVNAAIQGIIQGLMMPARQSMLSDLVYPRHIMNAVALNNAGMNVARLLMPTLGGLMLAGWDAHWVFFVMAALYGVAVITLFKVPAKPIEIPPEEQIYTSGMKGRFTGARRRGLGWADIRDGFAYMWRDRTVGMLLLVNFLMVLFSMPYMQLLPGFVKEVLGGGSSMQGALMSVTGIGSLVAALVVASIPSRRRGALLLWGGLLLGVSLTAFSFSSWLWFTVPVMVVLGAGQSLRMALSNALVQNYVDDEFRGRVMSIYMMEMNLVQVGTFGVALAAEVIGIQWALGLTSIMLIVITAVAAVFIPRLRALD